MTREEFIAKLQMVYVGDRNAFNEIVGVYDNLKGSLQTHEILLKTNVEENQKLNNVLNELERRIEKTKSEIDDLLIYDDFSDTTKGFGNIPELLKFYLSKYEHIEEFRINELKESNNGQ